MTPPPGPHHRASLSSGSASSHITAHITIRDQFAVFLNEHLGEEWSYDVENDYFDLKDAFVTPLIVTQLLNFLVGLCLSDQRVVFR